MVEILIPRSSTPALSEAEKFYSALFRGKRKGVRRNE